MSFRLIAATLLAALLLGVVLLSTIGPAPANDPSGTPFTSLDPASEEVLSSAIEGLTAIAQRYEHTQGGTTTVAESVGGNAKTEDRAPDPCHWWPEVEHNTGGLAGIFLFGHVSADDLWRHHLLNPDDRAPCPPDRTEFDSLMLQIGRHLDTAADRCSVVKLEEMVAIARAGGIPTFEPAPVSEASLRTQARITARSRRELGMEADETAILEELRRAGIRRPSGASHVSVDGKFYLMSSFPNLPRTEAAFEAVRMCAMQAALAVMGFFIAHGYCTWDARMDTILEQIMTRPLHAPHPVDASASQRASERGTGK